MHTPGPWKVGSHPWNIQSDTTHIGSATFTGFQPTLKEKDEVCANARLMAAAPDLYAAVLCMLTDIRDIGHVGPKTKEQAFRALAKAEGK